MSSPSRSLVPQALLAQLRERRDQQRAQRACRVSLIETVKGLIDSPRPDPAKAATAFVDGMDALQFEVEDGEDAFLLDPGMGPMAYLMSDGRVLQDHRSWDCPRCEGDRWDKPLRAHGVEIICTLCYGRGWATADMLANAQARGGAL